MKREKSEDRRRKEHLSQRMEGKILYIKQYFLLFNQGLLTSGQISGDEAKKLFLNKLYGLVKSELNRYLNAKKRRLIHVV